MREQLVFAIKSLQQAIVHINAAKKREGCAPPSSVHDVEAIISTLEYDLRALDFWRRVDSVPYYGG